VSDVSIALSAERFTPRFKKAERLTEAAHAKYPDAIVDGSGHSLGSGVLVHTTQKYGAEPWVGNSVGFNSATSPA